MNDDFGLYPREEPFDPFSVMLFKALQVIAFLFFIALLAITPDAKDGKISYNSPLGRALIGREKGDEVEVSTPSGDRYYEIAKVEFK